MRFKLIDAKYFAETLLEICLRNGEGILRDAFAMLHMADSTKGGGRQKGRHDFGHVSLFGKTMGK